MPIKKIIIVKISCKIILMLVSSLKGCTSWQQPLQSSTTGTNRSKKKIRTPHECSSQGKSGCHGHWNLHWFNQISACLKYFCCYLLSFFATFKFYSLDALWSSYLSQVPYHRQSGSPLATPDETSNQSEKPLQWRGRIFAQGGDGGGRRRRERMAETAEWGSGGRWRSLGRMDVFLSSYPETQSHPSKRQ